MIPFQPLELESYLTLHSNDTTSALKALLSDHNELLKNHKALQLENNQLWRTLKSTSTRGNEGSSVPGGAGSGGGLHSTRGGSNASTSSAISTSPRKALAESSASGGSRLQLPSSESTGSNIFSTNQSQPPLLALPNESNGISTPPRKGASLDLARPGFTTRDPSPSRSPRTPNSGLLKSAIDLTTSTSMPVLNHNPNDSTESGSSRYLPQITPVSPMDMITPLPNSRPSPLPVPSLPSPSLPSSNHNSNESAYQLDPPPPQDNSYQSSLPLPSFPSSPSRLPSPVSPLSPPPSSVESMLDPKFEQQQSQHHFDSPQLPAFPVDHAVPETRSLPLPKARPILSPSTLPFCTIHVGSSNITLTEKGRETVSFVIDVDITTSSYLDSPGKDGSQNNNSNVIGWRLEKLYSEIVKLDSLVRSKISRQELKTLRTLPDKALFKDHSPHKSDQRKAILERYLQGLTTIGSVDQMIICAFFNSDLLVENPTSRNGGMEGWLSKRGRSFGGWQTRYYVLSIGSLSYYESKEGTKLGEINISQASIGRQSSRSTDITTDDTYLHAFLIRTVRTSEDKDQDADHILCAENDENRDAWVNALTSIQAQPPSSMTLQRPILSTIPSFEIPTAPLRSLEAAENRKHNRKQSISSITSHESLDYYANSSNSRRVASSDLPHSTSSTNNNSMNFQGGILLEKRSTSELGHYLQQQQQQHQQSEEQHQQQQRQYNNKLQPQSISRGTSDSYRSSNTLDRPVTPEPRRSDSNNSKIVTSDVSGPMNAVPLPTGYQFKPDPNSGNNSRNKKTKSSFWNFSSRNHADKSVPTPSTPPPPSRPVFGIPLKEAVAISRIRPGLELPAIVYRCVEYLEAKNAELEEGIYRLSGSSNAIKSLKDRFNAESDVNLLASPVYYDCHCIAGLLKLYFRELPIHILTRELHPEFIKVIELREREDRVYALTQLVARLPIENYTVFRFFFAHLCVIAQSEVSKMGLRNLGIVFSPTLAMPAPLFSLLLSEFDTVFAVEQSATNGGSPNPQVVEEEIPSTSSRPRPNSVIYTSSNANYLMEGSGNRLIRQEEDEEDEEDGHHLIEESSEADILPQHQHFHQRSPSNSSPPPNSIHSTRNNNNTNSNAMTIPSSPRPGNNFFSQSSQT